jgi:hypothetical protein
MAIRDGSGFALILYDTIGTNVITNSTFSNNGRYPFPIGGGVTIEFTYCDPGTDCTTPIDKASVSNSHYIIDNNEFEFNTASPQYNLYPRLTTGSDYYGFGTGGGISCIFRGVSFNNTIDFISNSFHDNIAQYGGGLFVGFNDDASGNTVSSTDDTVAGNVALPPDIAAAHTGIPTLGEGGGAMLYYGSTGTNAIYINSSEFFQNGAITHGGAVSVHSINKVSPVSSQLVFDSTSIHENSAKKGAAIYFTSIGDYSQPNSLQVTLYDGIWSLNNIDNSCSRPPFETQCSGIVYTNMISLLFSGNENYFRQNTGSALHVNQATVNISSMMTFTGNQADNGGAIHLSNCGKILLTPDIDMIFDSNRANRLGGAIYESGCTLTPNQCFIEYTDSKAHPDDWTARVFLTNNYANRKPNVIYTDSLLPCTRGHSSVISQKDIKETFCWKSWYYDGGLSCHNLTQSGPVNITVTTSTTTDSTIPGEPISLIVKAYNEYGNEQNEEISICLYSGFGSLFNYPSTNPDCFNAWTSDSPINVTLYASSSTVDTEQCGQYSKQHAMISVTAINPPSPQLMSALVLDQCPEGTYFKCPECHINLTNVDGLQCYKSYSCDIPQSSCTISGALKSDAGYCWNFNNTNSSLSNLNGGSCPYSQNTPCVLITNIIHNPDSSLCPSNREGRLCGKCSGNFSLSINTIDLTCIECNGMSYWPYQLIVEISIVTVMIIIIVIFSISLNAGGTNAFLFFAQVISLKYPGLSYPSWVFETDPALSIDPVSKGVSLIYSIFNLDIVTPLPLPPYCFVEKLEPAQAILLDLLVALYSMLLLGILYGGVILYSYKFKPLYIPFNALFKMCRRRKLNYSPSLLDSFATVTMILFCKVAATCVKLLNPTFYYSLEGDLIGTAFYYDGTLDYFGNGHIIYAIISSVILVFFILLPAALLTISPCIFQLMAKCRINSRRLMALSHSYNESFKNGTEGSYDFRFFAGVYLFLRVAVCLLYLLHDIKIILAVQMSLGILVAAFFMLARPYKFDNYNNIDAMVFLYLSLLAGLSAIGYARICYNGLLYVPLLAIVVYLAYRVFLVALTRCKRMKGRNYQYTQLITIDDDASDDNSSTEEDEISPDERTNAMKNAESNDSYNTEEMFADRLLNPDKYKTAGVI